MARTLDASLMEEFESPQGRQGSVWLLELTLDRGDVGSPPVIARLCDGNQQLQWPLGDPDTTTWYPFPFTFSPVEQTNEGDLTQVELSVDNSTRMLMRWLHAANGFEGNPAKLFLVPRAALSIAYPDHEFESIDLEVMAASANGESISLRLGQPNWFQIMSPQERHGPKCRWQFGSPQCGYVRNAFSSYTTCPGLIDACAARGADMVARGLPNILPANFGGKIGLSRQR